MGGYTKSRAMAKARPPELRLGISACLLGEQVRYDGGHKRDAFLTDVSARTSSGCRCARGRGRPRRAAPADPPGRRPRRAATRRREDGRGSHRADAALRRAGASVSSRRSICTATCSRATRRRAAWSACASTARTAAGRWAAGLFAAALTDALPLLPVEEEGRLTDAGIRESFIERVFAAARWQAFTASRPRVARPRGVPRRAQVRDPRAQPAPLRRARPAGGRRGPAPRRRDAATLRHALHAGAGRPRHARPARQRAPAPGRLPQARASATTSAPSWPR